MGARQSACGGVQSQGSGDEHGVGRTQGEVNPPREPTPTVEGITSSGVNAQALGSGASQITGMAGDRDGQPGDGGGLSQDQGGAHGTQGEVNLAAGCGASQVTGMAAGFGGHAGFGSFSLSSSAGASSSGTAQVSRLRSNEPAASQAVFGSGPSTEDEDLPFTTCRSNFSVLQKDNNFSTDRDQAVIHISPSVAVTEDADLLHRILTRKQKPTFLPLELLKDITDGFSEKSKIGHGGFGNVYKGIKRIDQNTVLYTVAVKRSHTTDDTPFLDEVTNLMKADHQNIVRILGYCCSTHERLLCLEYISNGSLDKLISDELSGFDWETRYKIITGICEGLRYLHGKKINHMDLKPGNILLDGTNMVPKITDFGLSRPNQDTHTEGQAIGTSGYIAPEYRNKGKITSACDIYSLGAVIMELVTGDMEVPNINNVLQRWRQRWSEPRPQLQDQQVTTCMEIAERCRVENPEARPSISEIISTLRKPESTHGKAIASSSYEDGTQRKLDRRNFKQPESFSHGQPTNRTYLVRDSDRAMDATRGAMGSLLHKLGVLHKEFNLNTSIKKDADMLVKMQQVLRHISDVQHLDDPAKLWVTYVRDLSYDLEDFVDGFLEHTEPVSDGSAVRDLTHEMCFPVDKGKSQQPIDELIKHHITKPVQDAAEMGAGVVQVSKILSSSGTGGDDANSSGIVDPRLLVLYKDKKDLVGIDGPLNDLSNILSDGHDDVHMQLKIVSIFGFGGLGKTTLARALFDKIRSPFDCSAFVPVGRKPSTKKLLNDILYGIDNNKYPELDEMQLIDKLRGLLEKKRYLIVIDDIWDTETWDIVSCALYDNSCASRIITTTRILDVASKTGEVFKLEPLSRDLSQQLFQSRVFGGGRKCPSDFPVMVYDKLLHKCGGVPLAIITIASLLVSKPVECWSKVYNSIGFGHEDNKDVENTRKILLFSYYDLPCRLRTCLLYLSIYPEDSLIKKDSLIWKWVGEGFITEEPGIGSFETGERYFNELINKSMLLPEEDPDKCIITGCRLHDMILDMVCVLAKDNNFVTIFDSSEQYTSSHTNVRRIAIGKREHKFHARMPMPQVRSFNSMCWVDDMPSLSCFKVLRVLDVIDLYKNIHLEHLGKLVHLRYLRISGMAEVPKEIGHLKFLQVLDLGNSYEIRELPKSIGLLHQLKCLNANNVDISRAQCWIGNLTSLEELRVDSVKDYTILRELRKLTELRKLHISGVLQLNIMELNKVWADSLVKLQKIQVIDVSSVSLEKCSDITYEGYVLPQELRVVNLSDYKQRWLLASIKSSSLPNLTHLSVYLHSPDVEIFGRFPGLVVLNLYMDRPHQGHHVVGGAGVGLFPKLRVYKMNATPGQFLPGAMPSLESLEFVVDVCTSRDGNIEFDFGSLVNLPMLQKVTIQMWRGGASEYNSQKTAETVRHAISILPKHPALILLFS